MNTPIIIFNFKEYWRNPFVNKFIDGEKYEGIMVFENDKKVIWFSHPFNFEQVKKEYGKKIIIKELNKDSLKMLKKRKIIGYDSRYTTVSQLKSIKKILKKNKIIDISKDIEKKREIKTKEEIKKISIAVKNTKKIILKSKKKLKKGVSEKQIEEFVKKEFKKNKMIHAFIIIAFGKNTKNLHHVSTKTKLMDGPVLFDIGGKYKGYCSDISESFWFGKKEKKYFEYEKELVLIKKCLKKIEKKLREGIKAKELFTEVKKLKLPHSLGHGIGLEEHDYPIGIGNKSNWKLKKGMVLAIEPGKYNKFGIRIEKNYLIKKDGFKEL
ncbi:MAG: M24 family metallopeptidase [Candidatus ainarchaeum sp.]|nr:M24 family metallopeptidase [Candidatus ainarchaeum sp.]